MKNTILSLILTVPCFAATNYILPGNSEYAVWNLNRTNYNNTSNPAYPVSGATNIPWGGSISANTGSATFTRVSGTGYFVGSGSGIYNAFEAGSYKISDTSPVPNLVNLIFQSRLNISPTSLTLNYNGGSQGLVPNFFNTSLVGSGTFGPISDFAWQWDLSSLSATLTSYEIILTGSQNLLIYGNLPGLTAVSTSDDFIQAIPEPSSILLGLVACTFTTFRRRV